MKSKNYLYLEIANILESQIQNKILNAGEKLPSVRTLSREKGVALNTILLCYFELERRGLVESRPKSGYYVCCQKQFKKELPSTTNPLQAQPNENVENIFFDIVGKNISKAKIMLSSSLLDPRMLPVSKLNKAINIASRELPYGGLNYDRDGGHRLKMKIAQRSLMWGGKLKEEDIITTAGCMEAISFCLAALTEPGDTIAVESPVYFGILRQARNMKLNVLELPMHPVTGVEVDALKSAILKKKVKICLFISNFSNPLGSTIPDANKKEMVMFCEQYNIPLIENDIFGDLYFGPRRPTCFKTYDKSGIVLWCGSFSKTLAPGYRVGWIAPGKFKDKVSRIRYYHSLYGPSVTQEAVAQFLDKDRYEAYLRKLRQYLRQNCTNFLTAIDAYFPASTKVTRPEGGMHLWIELDAGANTIDLYNKAIANKISISPGCMYTLQNQYNNCFKLSFAQPWNEQIEGALKLLGKLAAL